MLLFSYSEKKEILLAKERIMRVINIRMPYDWGSIDTENDNIDVFVDTPESLLIISLWQRPKISNS